MAKKRTKSEVTNSTNTIPEDAYVTWGDDLSSKEQQQQEQAEDIP
jgi:hypothetical protein